MDKKPTTVIVIPTYNEKDNITEIIKAILNLNLNIHILVVDDNSPDGTGEIVEQISKKIKEVQVIHRTSQKGMGKAYIDGFKSAISRRYDYVIQMDADLSHDPKYIPDFLVKMNNYDLVVGSRYVNDGVSVVNWPIKRLILSLFANKYVRFITGIPVNDATSGFRCWRREVLERIGLHKIVSEGYSFQVEMLFEAYRLNAKIYEVPIIFIERRLGRSKISKGVILESAFLPWKLLLKRLRLW